MFAAFVVAALVKRDAAIFHQVLHFADNPPRALSEAARALRPGGFLLVADFAPHDLEDLRKHHAHRRLGFADEEMERWFRAAGLRPEGVVHLPGEPLTVSVWTATRPGGDSKRMGPRSVECSTNSSNCH